MERPDAHTRATSGEPEDAGCLPLDHLHTPATELAGVASKASGSDAPSPFEPPARRRRAAKRFVAVAATVTALLAGAAPAIASPSGSNTVHPRGGAPDLGPGAGGMNLNHGLVDITTNPSGDGYWTVSADGGVFTFGNAPFHGSAGGMHLNAPVVAMAAARGGAGYWLTAWDGGVFTFGNAAFRGSLGGTRLNAPIMGIAPTSSGEGYWLVGADGGVFTFGDAGFYGSAAGLRLNKPVVGIAPTRTGRGYWLVATDGGVFSFGDAQFHGAPVEGWPAPAVGITASADGAGYWIARDNGVLHGMGVPSMGDAMGRPNPVTGLTARPAGGYWLVEGERPPPPPPPPPAPRSPGGLANHPFLVCTRRIESGGNYGAVNPSGTYRGAYQFSRSTWDSTARHAGRSDLVGVDPAAAAPADQDFLALHLYQWQGAGPWLGRCAGL
jgi:hypothetical protein